MPLDVEDEDPEQKVEEYDEELDQDNDCNNYSG